jgi:DnaJ-domain-containing protein 1
VAGPRTLHVRCTTWEQVELFVTRKLRKGRFLSMKVPFAAKLGTPVTLGLELPNQLVIAIEGVVQRASAVEGDAAKTWIEVELVGLTDDVLARIRAMARGEEPEPEEPEEYTLEADEPQPAAPVRRSQVMESVGNDLPMDERELFLHLSGELRRLRQAAVHEVLGVARNADAEQVRAAWKSLIRRQHPDLVAQRDAPAITHLAEELTILANRAYDRLRAALVAEGRGATAGPTVAAPPGWLVGFDDIQSDRTPAPRPKKDPIAAKPAHAPGHEPSGSDAFELRARAMLAQGDASTAREVLAAALVVYPRSKPLRSLYYVATALAALQNGEVMLAQSQLETALAHHDQCVEAAQMLDHIKKHGGKRAEDVQRLFA